jgi:hypothetical protein
MTLKLRREPRAVYRVYGEDEFLADPADFWDGRETRSDDDLDAHADAATELLDVLGPEAPPPERWAAEGPGSGEAEWPVEDPWPAEEGLDDGPLDIPDLLRSFPPPVARGRRLRRGACMVMLGGAVGIVGGVVAVHRLRPTSTAGNRRGAGLAETRPLRATVVPTHPHSPRPVLAAAPRKRPARAVLASTSRSRITWASEHRRRPMREDHNWRPPHSRRPPAVAAPQGEARQGEAPRGVLTAQAAPSTSAARTAAGAPAAPQAPPHAEFGFER